jgi:hypothetical protein
MSIYIYIVSYYKLFLYFNLCLSKCNVNGHERLSNITLRQTQITVKEQLVVRNDMDVNEHERLSNITLRQTQIKVKQAVPLL